MKEFKTESKKLLDLVINSIYTNKDVFLRELISNGSDALDKIAFKAQRENDEDVFAQDPEIFITLDAEGRTLTVSDNGIGMSAAELETNLGTIAHSDSLEFKSDEEARASEKIDVIGQFGVGFYSAFMVADKVEVISRAYGSDEANLWESDGQEGFSISPATRDGHGTDVILHIREDEHGEEFTRYLNHPAIEELVKRYSNYIRYPICMDVSGKREVPRPKDAKTWEPVFEDYTEHKVLNSMIPIWSKGKSEVSDEEYAEFYKTEFKDHNPPLRVISMHARGRHSCDVLLFIPSQPSADFYSKDYEKGLELYSSGVMIMERCEALVDESFGFLRGIVDTPDISLNLSRSSIAENEIVRAIAYQIKKRVKAELENMRDNERATYDDFFSKFGRIFKFAIYATFGAKNEDLEDLLMYWSVFQEKPVTFAEYEKAMPKGQPYIYFSSAEATNRSTPPPSVVAVTEAGYDVLLCFEGVDEFCMMTLRSYHGHELKNVSGEDLGLASEAPSAEVIAANEENTDLFAAIKRCLGADVVEVCASTRAQDAPACITTKGSLSLGMEKYFASVADDSPDAPRIQHVLELNPNHHIFKALVALHEAGEVDKVNAYANILYSHALLIEGLGIKDVERYIDDVCSLM